MTAAQIKQKRNEYGENKNREFFYKKQGTESKS